jgi:hypothetical protein
MAFGRHFSDSKISTGLLEPVYNSLFKATFTLPLALRTRFGTDLLHEQLKKLGDIDFHKFPELVEQHFKHVSREFVGTIVDTKTEIECEFEVNTDENGIMWPYNILYAWSSLCWDDNTGLQTTKKDYVGQIDIAISDKIGNPLREIYAPICFPMTKPNAMTPDSNDNGIYTLTMKFKLENLADRIQL